MTNKLPIKEIPRITVEEWEQIVVESNTANRILNHPDFAFLLEYLTNAKNSCIDLVAHNSIKDVLETQTGDDGYSKTIKTTKEEQLNELAGQVKFIEKLLADLNTFSNQKAELEQRTRNNELVIERSKEDDK